MRSSRWARALLLVLPGCFSPGREVPIGEDESSSTADPTTIDASESSSGSSESTTSGVDDSSTGVACADGVFDASAWDEACFAP